MNLNTCDQALWEELFGIDGSIVQTNKSNYWQCEPAMHNKNFVDGLSWAINRKELGASLGRTPALEYFSDNYMMDPEAGLSYNKTAAHMNVMKDIYGDDYLTSYGFNKSAAQEYFRKAAQELIADGSYKTGDTITIEIAWQVEAQIDNYGSAMKTYWEETFNQANTGLKLKVENWTGAVWSDVYYKKMMLGQFDIGFGSISGNSYDPINFLEVLKSDNSSGFTLNWGVDTSAVDGSLVWNNEAFSFDALWEAADHGVIIQDEEIVQLLVINDVVVERGEDGSVVVYLYVDEHDVDEDNFAFVAGICLYATTDAVDYSDYTETYVLYPEFVEFTDSKGNDCYKITFDAETITAWLNLFPEEDLVAQGIDLWIVEVMFGDLVDPRGYGYYYLNEEETVVGCYLNTIWTGYISTLPLP